MNVRGLPRSTRSRLLLVLTGAAVLEVMWTIYIGLDLPPHYVANHWNLAWVGLDVAQITMLLASAWAAWKRRAILSLFATSAATLLVIDAWFDVTTARRGDILQSILFAALLELPWAFVLFWLTRRTIRQISHERYDDIPMSKMTIPESTDKFFL
jgi:hypothetical protein